MTLVHRSLIAMAECPACGLCYLGSCAPMPVPEPLAPFDDTATWYQCEHQPAAPHWNWIPEPHRWYTLGLIEVRPVRALHVDVIDQGR